MTGLRESYGDTAVPDGVDLTVAEVTVFAWVATPTHEEHAMLITTGNDLPGHDIERVLGEVFGLTVRSRNLGSQLGASLKSLVGGELQGMTTMLAQGREQAIERLVEEATRRGGNAIVAMRFDTSELGSTWTEICAYGTAVVARGL